MGLAFIVRTLFRFILLNLVGFAVMIVFVTSVGTSSTTKGCATGVLIVPIVPMIVGAMASLLEVTSLVEIGVASFVVIAGGCASAVLGQVIIPATTIAPNTKCPAGLTMLAVSFSTVVTGSFIVGFDVVYLGTLLRGSVFINDSVLKSPIIKLSCII